MLVIFASSWDAGAATLAQRWAAYHASLLTCDDLSRVGWRHHVGSPDTSAAVIDGKVVPVRDISGIVIRWPGVFPAQLTHIVAADRDYVSQEMRAFLVSWLSGLHCPVINQPTPMNLTGPPWRIEQWTRAAARVGMSIRPVHRRIVRQSPDTPVGALPGDAASVTVVGERTFGAADESLQRQARDLARAAGVRMLQVWFTGPSAGSYFLAANPVPEISDAVADAILSLLIDPAGES